MHRAAPGWSVVVGLERLEKAASRAAFVAWAEITTALRHDGTEWHRASYRLQNRSLQFLPVRLPAGAELMSARVAGQSVRADADKSGKTILIPLIKTKPGDLAYDVELIYRTHGGVLGWLESRRFDDPDLVGITVERTIWNVWLPNDRHLWKAGGNVEPVLAAVNRTEKLEGMLQEAKALSAMCLSPLTSVAVRKSASENFYRLKKTIEETSQVDAEYDGRKPSSGASPKPTPGEDSVGKKGVKAQQAWVSDKRKEISDALDRETAQVKSLDLSGQQMPAQVQQQVVNASDFFLNAGTVQQSDSQGVAAPVNGAVALGDRWDYNKDFKTAQPSTPVPAPAQPGNNLYLNDNVVLQQRIVPQPQKPASSVPGAMAGRVGGAGKGGGEKAESEKKAEQPAPKNAPDWDRGMSKHLDGSVELGMMLRGEKAAAEGSKAKPQDERVLNTARGNVTFQRQQTQEFQSQAGAIRTLPPQAATPAPAAVTAAPAPAGPENAFTGMATGGVRGEYQRYPGLNETAINQSALQPQGRISLDVDFPTEGQVLHFKKMKSNAQIELRIVEPDAFTRWKWLGLALALGLVLWALAVWSARRRKPAAALHRAPAVA